MAKDPGFDRDFGYLMPFFDRITSAASGLSPEASAELKRLMTGEKEKWLRIRGLLSGNAPTRLASDAPSTANRGPQPQRSATSPELRPTLTVGSLRRRE